MWFLDSEILAGYKRNEEPTQTIMWINLENTLSGRGWSREYPFIQFYLYEMFRILHLYNWKQDYCWPGPGRGKNENELLNK